jgi:hypothetical protein
MGALLGAELTVAQDSVVLNVGQLLQTPPYQHVASDEVFSNICTLSFDNSLSILGWINIGITLTVGCLLSEKDWIAGCNIINKGAGEYTKDILDPLQNITKMELILKSEDLLEKYQCESLQLSA